MNPTMDSPKVVPLQCGRIMRHDLDAERVRDSVQKRVQDWQQHDLPHMLESARQTALSYERAVREGTTHHWPRAPLPLEERLASIRAQVQSWIDLEHTYYALVRVLELPQAGERFILVYGDADDETTTHGTGPFTSFEKAANWFYRQGR